MAALAQLHLPDAYARIVTELLRRHVPDADVWAYGSRVRGDHHEASDLDLVVRQPGLKPLDWKTLDQLKQAFSDSDLPILVQVVDWARIPATFRAEIEQIYSVIQG
jgi:predicted nucleotidyltransferase